MFICIKNEETMKFLTEVIFISIFLVFTSLGIGTMIWLIIWYMDD
jgi:uncharacterized membrane protein YqjE